MVSRGEIFTVTENLRHLRHVTIIRRAIIRLSLLVKSILHHGY